MLLEGCTMWRFVWVHLHSGENYFSKSCLYLSWQSHVSYAVRGQVGTGFNTR